MRLIPCSIILLAALTSSAHAESVPPGGTIDKALTANVTPDGLDFLLDQGVALIPPQVDIPTISGIRNCPLISDLKYTIYQGQPTNGVNVKVNSAVLQPQAGYFNLALNVTVKGTGTDDPPGSTGSQTYVTNRVQYYDCGTSCNDTSYAVLRLSPTPISVTTRLDVDLLIDQVTGEPRIEVTTPLQRSDIAFSTAGLDAAGCAAIDLLEGVLGNFIGNFVKDEIIKQVNETLIPAIEEGFEAVRYDDTLSLAGKDLAVAIKPSALSIRTDGMSMSMSSMIGAVEPTTCVPLDGVQGSDFTPGDPPVFGEYSPSGFAYDAAAAISDDLVNQALFAAWHGGLLCQTLSQLGDTQLNTDLLAIAGLSGPLEKLHVTAGTPIIVIIKGYEPPKGTFGGDHTINIGLKRLEISIFTEVEERTARILALDLTVDAGADLIIDANNVLNVQLAIAPENILGAVVYSEPVGEEGAAGILNLLPIILDQIGPSLAEALPSIDLGNLAGVSLVTPEILATQGSGGVPNDTLGIYTGLAAAPGGCAAAGGGCGVGGGTGGCDLTHRASRANAMGTLLWLVPFSLVAFRRRGR